MVQPIVFLLGGVAILTAGAELLVRGSSRLALVLGVSPMVVGLTVVAFGTSTPELAASLAAQAEGQGAIALGNILGSNIANVGLILAIAALIRPLPVESVTLRRDLPFLAAATLAFVAALLHDGVLGRAEGIALAAGLGLFTAYQVRGAVLERRAVKEEYAESTSVKARGWPLPLCAVAIAVGLVLLMVGGNLLVAGAVDIARALGVSERVIGLTIVAIGTSCPELAAAIAAVVKKEVDVAVGNVVGSNIFNALGIGGVVGCYAPVALHPSSAALDIPVMLVATAVTCLFLWTRRVLSRLEGAILLAGYVAYLLVLVKG